MSQTTQEKDQFLEDGGSKYPSLKFENIGDTHTGVIVEYKKLEDRDPSGVVKKWDNGDTKYVYVFTLNTGTELGNLWVRGNMVKVIREAAQEAGITSMVGATLKVKFTGLGEQKNKAYHAPKLFAAKLEPAAPADDTKEMW